MRTIPVTYCRNGKAYLRSTKRVLSPHPAHMALARANAQAADACAMYGDALGSIVSADLYQRAVHAVRNYALTLRLDFH